MRAIKAHHKIADYSPIRRSDISKADVEHHCSGVHTAVRLVFDILDTATRQPTGGTQRGYPQLRVDVCGWRWRV